MDFPWRLTPKHSLPSLWRPSGLICLILWCQVSGKARVASQCLCVFRQGFEASGILETDVILICVHFFVVSVEKAVPKILPVLLIL